MVSLTVCDPAGFSACPTLFRYSQAEQARLADEVEAMPAESVAPRFLSDYAVVREEIRVCRGGR